MEINDPKALKVIVLSIAFFLLALFGWPTLYRYENTYNGVLVRINRVTGYTDYYMPGGWKIEP